MRLFLFVFFMGATFGWSATTLMTDEPVQIHRLRARDAEQKDLVPSVDMLKGDCRSQYCGEYGRECVVL